MSARNFIDQSFSRHRSVSLRIGCILLILANTARTDPPPGSSARSALDAITADLRQEIVAGSTSSSVATGVTIYRPTTPATMVPYSVGSNRANGLENLLKRSAVGQPFYAGAPYENIPASNRAADVATTQASRNLRSISLHRWNRPLLLRKASLTTDDATPTPSFTAPDWILAARDGSNPTVWSPNLLVSPAGSSVVGRYAYTIYDEGGLLDMNVAGHSSEMSAVQVAYKKSLADADLSQFLTSAQTDAIVAARGSQTTAFSGRQQLIDLLTQTIAGGSAERASLQNALAYLGTFSRDLNQPSYVPALFTDPNAPKVLQDGTALFGGNNAFGGDQIINPSFLEKRAETSFTRNDGTSATPGEPLVLKRFALERLSWVTYKGPSADNLADPIVTAMKAQGVPLALLKQGTADNIYKYFGLSWDTTNHRWVYDHNSVARPGTVPIPTRAGATSANIFTLRAISGREPDFFELLKATLTVGSLGKHGSLGRDQGQTGELLTQGTKSQYRRDVLVDMHCFAIGLNIIDQADPDSYPSRLLVWNPISTAPATRELSGVENLPYFYRFRNGVVRLQEASTLNKPADAADNNNVAKTGAAALMLYPELWNPHAANSPATGINPQTNTPFSGLAPTAFQIAANSVDPDHYGSELPMELSQNSIGDSRFKYTEIPAPIISPRMALSDNPTGAAQRNPALRFEVPAGNNVLFREPTVLLKSNTPAGTNLRVVSWPSEVSSFVSGGGLTSSTAVGSNIPPNAPANGGQTYSASSITGNGPFVGLLMGRAPLQVWRSDNQYTTVSSLQGNFQGQAGVSLAVRLQYQDPWGTYVTYNEVAPPILSGVAVRFLCEPGDVGNLVDTFDPRTARFGMMQNDLGNSFATISATGISETNRSRANDAGRGFKQNDFGRGGPNAPGGITWNSPDPQYLGHGDVGIPAPGWFGANDGWSNSIAIPALIAQNDPSFTSFGNMFYADPDGVVRRATGAYARTAAGGVTDPGNPMKTGDNPSKPIILNRPFRSVAELGHVFRDTPWKNLDFFTPESGDAALLDLFCISESANPNQLVVGKVNLNTRQQPVLKAILAGAFKDELNSLAIAGALAPLSTTEADNIATALTTWSRTNPLQNIGDVIGRWSGTKTMISNIATFPDQTGKGYGVDGKLSYLGFTKQLTAAVFDASSQSSSWNIQRTHESATRALAAVGQTRVWNLMIDVVSQSGSYSSDAVGLADFMAEGEQRYWLHLAIDRFTGEVLDQSLEEVPENLAFPTDITLTNASILEEQPPGTTVGGLDGTGPNPGSSFTFTLVGGNGSNDNSAFQVVGNTLVTATTLQYFTQPNRSIRLRITDQDGLSFEKTFAINVLPGPYSQWKIANFSNQASNPAIAGDLVDADGDGLSNLVEYALQKNPKVSNTSGVFIEKEANLLRMTYTRNSLATDVSVHAFQTVDLKSPNSWTQENVSETMLSDDGAIQLWEATMPLASEKTLFMRLRITR